MHDGGVLTAKFWSENEHQNKTFVYKGSLSDPRTLEEPKTPLESFEASKNRGAKEDEDDSYYYESSVYSTDEEPPDPEVSLGVGSSFLGDQPL